MQSIDLDNIILFFIYASRFDRRQFVLMKNNPWGHNSNRNNGMLEVPLIRNLLWFVLPAIVTGDTVNEIYSRVKEVIRGHSGQLIWIPARQSL